MKKTLDIDMNLIRLLLQEGIVLSDEIFVNNSKAGQIVARGVYKNKSVIVKIISKSNDVKYRNYQKEISVDNFLIESLEKVQKVQLYFPKILKFGENDIFFWLIREYIQGDSLSSTDNQKKLNLGYDILRKKYLTRKDEIIGKIVGNLFALQRIKKDRANKTLPCPRFEVDLEKYHINDLEKGLGIDISSSADYYNSQKKSYFNDKKLVASTNDLVPANVIVTDKEVFLSDFEWLTFDNSSVDFAFLWLFFWKHPDWQKTLLVQYQANGGNEDFFRASIVRLLIGYYNNVFRLDFVATPYIIKRRALDRAHIWPRYLVSAGKSFNELINTK